MCTTTLNPDQSAVSDISSLAMKQQARVRNFMKVFDLHLSSVLNCKGLSLTAALMAMNSF